MSKFVEQYSAITRRLNAVTRLLGHYSTTFAITGNDMMAENLRVCAEDVDEMSKEIVKMCGDKISEDLNQVQENNARMMTGLLNAVLLAPETTK
jgi:hypothetical protein